MPFQSEDQRRYMHANLPDIAKRWERDYAGGGRIGYRLGTEEKPEQNNLSGILENLTQEQVDKDPERYAQLLISLREPDYTMGEHGKTIAYWKQPGGGSIGVPWGFSYGTSDWYPQNLIGWESHNKAQGGLIPAHQAGIYGLAEGGQLVSPSKTGERPGYQGWDPGAGAPQATSAAPPGEKGGPGPTFEEQATTTTTTGDGFNYGEDQEADVARMMKDMGIVDKYNFPDYGGGWVPSEDEETEIGGADYIGPKDQVRIQNDILNRKKKYDSLWASTKRGYKAFKSLPKPTGVLWVDIPRIGYFMYQQNKLKKERIAEIDDDLSLLDKTGATKFSPHTDTIYQQLEQEKLDLLQPKKRPDEDTGGDGITYPAIARVNEQEADKASYRQRTAQKKVDRSKQMAYWRMMMTPHMGGTRPAYVAAQGGRVPQGYNTGGLSNLFRLKNV